MSLQFFPLAQWKDRSLLSRNSPRPFNLISMSIWLRENSKMPLSTQWRNQGTQEKRSLTHTNPGRRPSFRLFWCEAFSSTMRHCSLKQRTTWNGLLNKSKTDSITTKDINSAILTMNLKRKWKKRHHQIATHASSSWKSAWRAQTASCLSLKKYIVRRSVCRITFSIMDILLGLRRRASTSTIESWTECCLTMSVWLATNWRSSLRA